LQRTSNGAEMQQIPMGDVVRCLRMDAFVISEGWMSHPHWCRPMGTTRAHHDCSQSYCDWVHPAGTPGLEVVWDSSGAAPM
jgi:hypothetical protein